MVTNTPKFKPSGEIASLVTPCEPDLTKPVSFRDLFVTHELVSHDNIKSKGGGLVVRYGYHPTPFGEALILITDQGLMALGFADENSTDGRHAGEVGTGAFNRNEALTDMVRRWPNATYLEDDGRTQPFATRIFDTSHWKASQPLRVALIGTKFQIQVWEGLLKIPVGQVTTYSGLANSLERPDAARAVGAAVGRNPISFVVPCHRVVGKSGQLTGYYWGLDRKRTMLDWEARLSSS